MQFSGIRVGGGARQGGIDEKSAMKIAQKIRLKPLRPTITCSSQEGDAKQLWSSTSSFLGRANRVTAKRQKNFGGIFPKYSICPPLEFFHYRGQMFCLHYDIFIMILKFSYTFELLIL